MLAISKIHIDHVTVTTSWIKGGWLHNGKINTLIALGIGGNNPSRVSINSQRWSQNLIQFITCSMFKFVFCCLKWSQKFETQNIIWYLLVSKLQKFWATENTRYTVCTLLAWNITLLEHYDIILSILKHQVLYPNWSL